MTSSTPIQYCVKHLLAKITEEKGRLTQLVQDLQLIKKQEVTTPLLDGLSAQLAKIAPGVLQSMADSAHVPAAKINYELLKTLQRVAQFAGCNVPPSSIITGFTLRSNLGAVEALIASGRTDLFIR